LHLKYVLLESRANTVSSPIGCPYLKGFTLAWGWHHTQNRIHL